MNSWILKVKYYLNRFIEVGVLLLAASVLAEIIFGPDVAFFGSQVTKNLVALLNTLGDTRSVKAVGVCRWLGCSLYWCW